MSITLLAGRNLTGADFASLSMPVMTPATEPTVDPDTVPDAPPEPAIPVADPPEFDPTTEPDSPRPCPPGKGDQWETCEINIKPGTLI